MVDEHPSAIPATVRVVLVGDPSALEPATTAVADRVDEAISLRCGSPAEARDRLASDRVHCVVCLPEHVLDGSLLDAVDRYDERLPVFVVGSSSTAAAALEAGADDVIDPNERPAAVASRIDNAARRFRLERRDRTETALARGLLAGTDAVVAALDPDGTVSAVSSAVEPILGYTAGEVEGRRLSRFVHPSDRTTVEAARRTVESEGFGSRTRERVRLRHADGDRYVHALSMTNRLDDPAIGALVVTIERASRPATRDAATAALDRVDLPVLALDERWAVHYANEAAAELFEGSPGDARGVVVWDLLPGSIVSEFSERLREAARTGARVEFAVTSPSGERSLAVSAVPAAEGMVVYATPREPAAADADADRFEPILESLEDGVCVLEGSTIAYANAALFEELSVDVLEGREFAAVVDEDLVEAVRDRAEGPIRRMEPIEYVHDEPQPRRFDVFVTSLSADRTVCLFRPARRSPTAQLATLRRAVAGVSGEAPSQRHVRQATVDALVDAFDLAAAYWLVPEGGAFRPMESAGRSRDDPIRGRPSDAPIRGDDPRIEAAIEAATPTVVESSWIDAPGGRSIVPDVSVLVPVGDRGVVVARPDEREGILRSGGPIAAMGVFAEYVRTAFDAHEARIEGLEADRERSRAERTLASLSDVERAVDRGTESLLEATTGADVDRALCRTLASIDGVELAWVGDVDLSIGAVTPRESVGPRAYVESVETPVAAGNVEPSGRAVHGRAPVYVEDATVDRSAESWAATALEHGLRSALSVPLTFDAVTYGTVTAYATEPKAFDRHHRRAIRRLADVGAFVLAALEVRRALGAGTVTELEVLADAAVDPVARFVAVIDAGLDVDAVVPREEGGSTVYGTVDALPPVALDGLADGIDGLSAVRRRSRTDDRGTRERAALALTCSAGTVAERLAGHGGTVRRLAPHGDRVRFVIELLPDAVRRALDAVETEFGSLELRVRRTRDRSGLPRGGTIAAVRERLTDRQLHTLSAAYHGGYFEWPRERTGEQIARTLGVSQPTFNRHFRAAERNLFSLLFEGLDDEEGA